MRYRAVRLRRLLTDGTVRYCPYSFILCFSEALSGIIAVTRLLFNVSHETFYKIAAGTIVRAELNCQRIFPEQRDNWAAGKPEERGSALNRIKRRRKG